MEIALGSLVVNAAGGGLVMLAASIDGDKIFCVSVDRQTRINQWFDRAQLQKVVRPEVSAAA
jgi:hypothetical protein